MKTLVRFIYFLTLIFSHFTTIFAEEYPKCTTSKCQCDLDTEELSLIFVSNYEDCPDVICWDGSKSKDIKAKFYHYCPVNNGNTIYSQICKKYSAYHYYKDNSQACIVYYTKTEMKNFASVVNFYLSISDILKDYKQLSANFLEENDSISSIPKNLASLQTRHIHWVTNIEQILSKNTLDFDSIKDAFSYQNMVMQINTIATQLPDDIGLSLTETKFTTDIVRIQNELSKIKTRLDALLNTQLINKAIEITGANAEKLEADLLTTSKNMAITMNDLDNIHFSISQQRRVRQKIRNYTVSLWMATADKALDILNLREANDLIMQMKRSLASPFIYTQMLTDLNRLSIRRQEYFSTYYTPLLGRRSVFEYWQNAIDYQDKVVTSEDIDPLYKQQMQFKLDTVLNLIPSYLAETMGAFEKSDQYLNQRKKNVQTRLKFLDRENKKLTTTCQALADTILNDTSPASTIPSEINYVEFHRNCRQGIEK